MPLEQPATAVRVECRAGYRVDEAPVRFYLGTRRIEVAEVLDRWLGPAHRCFKVLGDDGDTYVLRHDNGADRWELTLFARGAEPPAAGTRRHSTLIEWRFAFSIFGSVSSSMPSLKLALALAPSTSAGNVTVRLKAPCVISQR